jgi:hypothetical protein
VASHAASVVANIARVQMIVRMSLEFMVEGVVVGGRKAPPAWMRGVRGGEGKKCGWGGKESDVVAVERFRGRRAVLFTVVRGPIFMGGDGALAAGMAGLRRDGGSAVRRRWGGARDIVKERTKYWQLDQFEMNGIWDIWKGFWQLDSVRSRCGSELISNKI